MRFHRSLLSALGAAGLVVGLLAGPAHAFPISTQNCGQFWADPAISCAGGTGQVEDEEAVGTLYPPETWTHFDKDEGPGETDNDFFLTDLYFNPVDYGNDLDGYFFIGSGLLSSYEEFILVLKGGSLTPRWAAFLIDTTQLLNGSAGGFSGHFFGQWSTDEHAVSHASLFVRNETSDCDPTAPDCNPPTCGPSDPDCNPPTCGPSDPDCNPPTCGPSDPDCNPPEVVEPGTLALMGLGLVGLGIARRRRPS